MRYILLGDFVGWVMWCARNCYGVVFLDEIYFEVHKCGFTCALFVGLLGGVVLVWPPLFCRIVSLVYPRWHCIVIVASVLGGTSWLQGPSLVFLHGLILKGVGCIWWLACQFVAGRLMRLAIARGWSRGCFLILGFILTWLLEGESSGPYVELVALSSMAWDHGWCCFWGHQ